MTRKKKTQITIATREVTVIRQTQSIIHRWCAECAAEVRMAGAEKAAAMIGSSTRALYRRVESAEIHFVETPDGRLLVCLNSL